MADSGLNLPGGFGGLMRFNEEYESKIKLTPGMVVAFVILVVLFVLALKVLWPVSA